MSESFHIHVQEDENGSEKGHHSTSRFDHKITALERIFLVANFVLELPSAVFDQLSSLHKLQFALLSMLISFSVLIISIIELVYRGRKEGVRLKKRGLIPWFYYPYPNTKPFGAFPDVVGLVCSIFQCFSATIAYGFMCRNSDNPIKVSIWPIIFSFGLLYSRFSGNYYAETNSNQTQFLRRLNIAEEFTLLELVTATENFSLQSKIGEWYFGDVYVGNLADGRQVTIKREDISKQRNKSKEEVNDFALGLKYLSRLHHKHLIGLIGYCEEDNERLLVFEYLKNGTVYDHLHCRKNIDKNRSIVFDSPKMRIKIALETARGIEYLHNYAVPSIIHGNINSGIIYLDDNWTVRVSGFRLSTLCLATKAAGGILGYTDPEYQTQKVLTAKSDIYSLGVVILELLTGKKAICEYDDNGGKSRSLADFAVPKIIAKEWMKVLDDRMSPSESANEVEAIKIMAYTALNCVNSEGNNRPNISNVVANLEQALSLCEGRSMEGNARKNKKEKFKKKKVKNMNGDLKIDKKLSKRKEA